MVYEFSTNWSLFSDFAGGVTGPLLAYEVLTAFFLEAGFEDERSTGADTGFKYGACADSSDSQGSFGLK